MPETRTLPIAAEHREFTIKVEGIAVPREHQLTSVVVTQMANRIASARLAYCDGAAAASDFPLSNSDLFAPGQRIEISAGTSSASHLLFQGVIVRHSLRLREQSAGQLIIDCRHQLVRLTVSRRSVDFIAQSDTEVIETLLARAEVPAEIEEMPTKHQQLIQFDCSDWDFLLARAEANGKLVFTRGAQVAVKAPRLDQSPVCSLQFGATLLELDAEIDARDQLTAIHSTSWDPATQKPVKVTGNEPSDEGLGNLEPSKLAEVAVAQLELRHTGLAAPEAQAWADAAWERSRLNKVTLRCKCQGIGNLHVGDVVTLAGVGQRFSGNGWVTGLRHEFDLVQGWKTHVQFGGLGELLLHGPQPPLLTSSRQLPAISGLQIGVVVSNEDPDGEHRLLIRMPLIQHSSEGIWARLATPHAGSGRGFVMRPEIGDEVVLGFFEDDPRCPVILGMLHSSARAAPLPGSDDNHEKLFQSRSGLRLYFNDEKRELVLATPAGNRLSLSEDQQAIVIQDQNGNSISLTEAGIQIDSRQAIRLQSDAETTIEAASVCSAVGGTELKLEGNTMAEFSSGGLTKITGSMVHIN